MVGGENGCISTNRNSEASSIIVWRFGCPLVIYEEVGVQGSGNGLKLTPWFFEVKKLMEIVGSSFIRKSERTLLDVENTFDEVQNATEVESSVANKSRPRVGRDHEQRHAKTVLIVTLGAGQNGGCLVVVPAAPIRSGRGL